MQSASDAMVHVFAYGSNMCTQRIGARVASAAPVTTGYVTHRRLVFHKRGRDGSAKADALYTGCKSHRVWGVVFSLAFEDMPVLDAHEAGYDQDQVVVRGRNGPLSASLYVARRESVDASLKPFAWYHRLVLHGARQHRLPLDYVDYLQAIEFIADPDSERAHRHAQLLGGGAQ